MPQASSSKKTSDVPYGNGSVVTSLQQARARTLRRAVKVNQGLERHCSRFSDVVTRHQTAEASRMFKALERLSRTIQELEAYKHVAHDFRSDNLLSMRFGFDPRRDARTPASHAQYITERKVMTCGFGVRNLRAQVLQTIHDLDPERLRALQREKELEEARKLSNFLIDKKITNDAMKREKQREAARHLSQADDIESDFAGSTENSTDDVTRTERLPRLKLPPILVTKRSSMTSQTTRD